MTRSDSVVDDSRVLLVGRSDCLDAVATVLRDRATTHTVETAEAALEQVRTRAFDCVLTEYELDARTGVELLTDLRHVTSTLPVILCTNAGDEAVASEAIRAGVSDYLSPTLPVEDGAALLDRIERVVRHARRTETNRRRARQFDAVFNDAQTATWVLDPDGSLARVNRTARELIDESVESVVSESFWTLPWWTGDTTTRHDVERLVERARDGRFGHAVITRPSDADTPQVVDLSVRPVEDERGRLVSIVVEGVDITERVGLERDLRASEELHRVTLNNMTDTVLITDEDGAYTYVCPNVHFIFGYTAEEIHEMGGIAELLGADLFDRADLAREGVLKNIECTATDKAGREHTLLVNVREVSIQDGTILYSCRDITKRKQREDALATLQETARDFLYAETHQEIAHHVVADTPSVLGLDAGAVYLFDADTTDLEPVASTARMRDLDGPLSAIHADPGHVVGRSFVENEPLVFDDIHESGGLADPTTGLRSLMAVPLGEHGVFVAGSSAVGVFDEITRELADLLAATAEAALDRVRRESKLREQDRTLQAQNDRLTELNRINETIREIDQAVVQAQTRAEIHHTVCELLTAADRFRFAWIGTPDPAMDHLEPQAWAGAERGYLDSRPFTIAPSRTEPSGEAAATGDVTAVPNVAAGLRDAPWRTDALSRDYLSVLALPLVYNDLSHGVLTVYAETRAAFDGTMQAVLGELAETVAAALSAIERKNALLTTSVTRVEFSVDDPTFVLTRLARAADCTVSYHGGVQQTTEGRHVFVTVDKGAVGAVERAAADLVAVSDVTRISTNGDDCVVQLRLTQPFLALELADHGAVFRNATASPEGTTLVVDVPESVAVRNVVALVREAFTDVRLQSKQTLDQSAEQDLFSQFLASLTDRQLEVVQTAFFSGYFESPRRQTGEEIAETLGISPTAFYQHTRRVQRKLFTTLFGDGDVSIVAGGG
ncbi:bacterio-opsin activator domain-containing protein [Salinirubrum litoreum]|uniref:Bacterio-opsin activator domain-containing protein n=1 Tax=Salinirubrum litoreum TaxID=1126234 RepID=A0ABD5RBQ2_9EURY|nr:bacterio-opsin activator domain-containing protein [Salinirubrum litoreum]